MFTIPELIVESVIREGLTNLRNDPTIVDDVFAGLLSNYATKKFGEREINKIKKFLKEEELAVVQAFGQIPATVPCISVQLLEDPEEPGEARLDDFNDDVQDYFDENDSEAQAGRVVLEDIEPTTYDSNSGMLAFPDSVDLTAVTQNQLFVDASGDEFTILGGIDNTDGSKSFFIKAAAEPDISDVCSVISSINFTQNELRGITSRVRVQLGIKSEDRLTTIYLYTLVKYILLSRKKDLINRGINRVTISGPNYQRDTAYAGDIVFSRFLVLSGMIEDSWKSDKVVPIENLEIIEYVAKDVATNEDLGLEDQTVQVDDNFDQNDSE